MSAVDRDGIEASDPRRKPAVDKPLAEMDVESLRRFLVNVMRKGGVSAEKRAKVMRVSKQTIFRDARPKKL
jgi:hypothetical protein